MAATAGARTASNDVTLDRGGFEEHDFRMVADANATYNWSSDSDLYFDLHSHQGAEVTHHVRNTSTNGTNGSFVAPSSQVYSLFWENRGQETVSLSWELRGDFGPREVPDGEETPAPGLGLAVVSLAAVALLIRHSSW